MANYDREVDHYEVIITNSMGLLYAEKEFFAEEEAVEYAKRAFDSGFTAKVIEVDNIIWWN